ncbi:MAG: gliding motility-associated ABC transporter permease subunit GldF [Bacteroidales bacterium]|nr:gliding motility-associated ABC transporter permease subunit GldF [Bacteroidales bacterium]NLK82425.1 gliding motility-associated ABC transporter permease subunit GldF [Bacteroidales bacterium]
MVTLFRKEIASFFSSLIGYIVIAVFLLGTGLFLWVFDGELNILQSGYAGLDGLFMIAPWIFLFLAPAISMRFFADESKSGTLELLFTFPISDLSIVLSKFFAGLVLMFIALLPTVLYFITVYALGSPVGNIDIAATIGAYIGLLFLAGVYVAIGTFVSSITDNQIISFIISAALCFALYVGFDFIAEVFPEGVFKRISISLGIAQHYDSISRGVIDTRDIVYFLSVISFFIYITHISLKKKHK